MPSMVIFTVGCDFKCEFCHNKHLLAPEVGKEVSIQDLLKQINTNMLVKGVSLTGGEPMLQPDIVEFCKSVKKTNKYISVDTNGSNPSILSEVVHFVDRIALDLKANPLNQARYQNIVGMNVNLDKILESFDLLNKIQNLDFEIRTTYVKNLMNQDDIHDIVNFLKEKQFHGNYIIQQYQYSEGVGHEYKEKFEKPLHSELLEILEQYNYHGILTFDLYIRDEVVGYKCIKSRHE